MAVEVSPTVAMSDAAKAANLILVGTTISL
jgi:hypothetical protein